MPHKILLIDDSTTQLEMLRLQFLKAGFEVVVAKDGSEGYRKIFEEAPEVILSDIMMPNLNGYQLCRLLKNDPTTSQIPVILLTVLDKKIDRFWGSKSGAERFISKTANFSDIEKITNDIIATRPVSEEYRNNLLNNKMSDEAVQNQINVVLDELLMNSTFLNEFRDLGSFLAYEKVLVEKIFQLIGSFVDYNIAGLFFNGRDRNEKHILHLDVNKSSISGFVLEKIKREFFSHMPGLPQFTIRDFGHDVVIEKVDNSEIITNADVFKTIHIIPLISDDLLLGGVCFYNIEECNYSEFKYYKTMISELLLLFRMRYLYSETEYLSVTDGLTGLYNRRHFEYNIEREFLRTKRYPCELSLAMVDIDHFKTLNDTHGHQFGDYVLKELSKIIASSFRKTDMIYRYGGEELAIILTETSLDNSLIPLDRLKTKISQYKFCYNDIEKNITVSIGVCSVNEELKDQHELIECSDKALYKAKQDGRNRVVAYINEEFEDVLQQQ